MNTIGINTIKTKGNKRTKKKKHLQQQHKSRFLEAPVVHMLRMQSASFKIGQFLNPPTQSSVYVIFEWSLRSNGIEMDYKTLSVV